MFSEEVKRVKAKSWKEPHLVWPSDFTDEKTPGSRSGNDVFKVTWLIKSTWTQMRLSLLIPLQNIFNKDFLAFVLRWWNYFLNWRGKKLTIYSSDTLKDSSFLVVCLIWKKQQIRVVNHCLDYLSDPQEGIKIMWKEQA